MNYSLLGCILGMALTIPLQSLADDLGIKVILEKEISPGVYGRVELGNDSHPETYYPHPTLIISDSRYAKARPVYLHVPPGHAKHWGKHCKKYKACDRPVYFIRSSEYDSYEREHEHEHSKKEDKKHPGKGKEKHHKH